MARVFIDSFSEGCFTVRSETGKQGIEFDESDRFGPSKVNMRTGDLSEIPIKHWFWRFYPAWRAAGRPTEGEPQSTPNGPLLRAVWPTSASSVGMEPGTGGMHPNPRNGSEAS